MLQVGWWGTQKAMYNINSGYGMSQIYNLLMGRPGKVFVVTSVTTNRIVDFLLQIFKPDPVGVPRFYTTIMGAMASCVANRGDIIIVMPGHAETISDATTQAWATAGVSLIGLGVGSLRPTLTFSTANTATVAVSADNVSITGFLLIANFLAVASAFTLSTAKDFHCEGNEFRDTSSVLNFINFVKTGSTANAADGLTFSKNRAIITGITALTTPVNILGNCDRPTINDNFITKAVLNNTSCLLKHAALVVTNLEMARNKIFSANTDSATGGFLITTSSTTNTGMVYDNYVQGLDVAGAILVTAGSKYGMFNNLYDGDADASGFVLPAIGTDA